jgi:hypothetical protein
MPRLLMAGAFAAVALASVGALYIDKAGNPLGNRATQALGSIAKNQALYVTTIVLSFVVCLVAFYMTLVTFRFTDQFVGPLLLRFLPITLAALLVSLSILICLPQVRFSKRKISTSKNAIIPLALALGGVFLVLGFIFGTGLGLVPDRADWDVPGVPILGAQVTLALLGSALLYTAAQFAQKKLGWQLNRVDILVTIALWLFALFLWNAETLKPTFFSPTPRAPNFSFYPHSDAANVDIAAQRLLTGYGFTEVTEKPLYSGFLAVLHALVGQDYLAVVAAQIAVLAFFPVVLYLIATQLHHRLSAGLLALVVTIREANTIALSGQIDVSHSKLLMTDLPATLLIAISALLLLRWFRVRVPSFQQTLLLGAVLGTTMLLRSQTILFVPVVVALAFWFTGPVLKTRLSHAGLVVLGFLLVTTPWMVRNYQHTGVFGYSQPLQARYLARQYSLTPELADPGFAEDVGSEEFVSQGFSRALDFTLQHPAEVVQFISSHFFHNIASSLLALPMTFGLSDHLVEYYNLLPYWQDRELRLWEECCGLQAYVQDNPYWGNWSGELPAAAWAPMLLNAALISFGIATVWRKTKWLTLVPIGVFLLYSFSTAIARVSGWRLILPVDWVVILFYCIGISQLALLLFVYLFGDSSPKGKVPRRTETPQTNRGLYTAGAAIFMFGMIFLLAEKILPPRYEDPARVEQAWHQIADEAPVAMDEFLGQSGAMVYYGRALYPRFYPQDQGEPGGTSSYNVQPFARMAFWVVGLAVDRVAFPIEASPFAFPNAVDVVVFGCSEEGYTRAAAVVFPNGEAENLVADYPDQFSCDR